MSSRFIYKVIVAALDKTMCLSEKNDRWTELIWGYNIKTEHDFTPNRIMILSLSSVLWSCRFLNSPDDDPASPSWRPSSCCSLRLTSWQRPRGSGFTLGRRRLPPWPHVVHEGLHAIKLGCQLSETLLQGVELLVEISQGVWQRLDPETNTSYSSHSQ